MLVKLYGYVGVRLLCSKQPNRWLRLSLSRPDALTAPARTLDTHVPDPCGLAIRKLSRGNTKPLEHPKLGRVSGEREDPQRGRRPLA